MGTQEFRSTGNVMSQFYKVFDGILNPDRNSVNADLCSPQGRSRYVKYMLFW